MSIFQGDHLRIKTPNTTDGNTLLYINGQIDYRIQYAPLESKRFFEQENKLRPTHLKHILEDVYTGFGNATTPQATQTKVKIRQ